MSSKCQVIDEGKIVLKFRIIDGPTGPTPFMRAIELGIFEGSEEEWYESLIGPPVPVAYELGQNPDLAVSQKLLTDSIGTMGEASSQAISAMQQANSAAVNEANTAKRAAQAAAQSSGEQAGLAGERATVTAELAGIATNKAESADQSARTATSRAEEARLHRLAAADSAATAAAVVTGGTATSTPEAGKIPLADHDGKIDIKWLGENVAAHILMSTARVNDIGIAGLTGFGVGICPVIPTGYTAMSGAHELGSENYGNYLHSDGSVMVWIPAYYERVGHPQNPTYSKYNVNSIDIQPLSRFASRSDASEQGYTLPRAFIDGGEVLPGFMHDKYRCSNNDGTASSIKNGKPLSSSPAHNPFSELTGSPANNYGGAFEAAKTRGAKFFPASRFMRAALATLAMAHGQAATSHASCAWFDPNGVTSFPKGNNNNAFGDVDDPEIEYTHDGYDAGNSALTGSGTPFAKTTHNGQKSGVCDLNGNMYTIELGMTCVASGKSITGATQENPVKLTVIEHGLSDGEAVMITSVGGMTELSNKMFAVSVVDSDTVSLDDVDGTEFKEYESGGSLTSGVFYVAKESTRMEDFTGGNSLATDHFGPTGVAEMMQPITIPMRTDYPSNGFAQRFGNEANQVLDPSVDGDGMILRGLGLPQAMGASTSGSSLFGRDYFYQHMRNELCLISGLLWSFGAGAGPWGVYLSGSRTASLGGVGLCAASYPVRPSDSEV